MDLPAEGFPVPNESPVVNFFGPGDFALEMLYEIVKGTLSSTSLCVAQSF